MKQLLFFLPLFFFLSCKESPKRTTKDLVKPDTKIAFCGAKTNDRQWYESDKKAPLFDNLGNSNYPISTQDEEAQRYFNQGRILAYAFNHAEAARSFYYATKLDSTCAMCYWGYAYVLGPNYNGGMDPGNYGRAYEAIQKAQANKDDANEKEQILIDALTKRYTKEPVEDRSELDQAYSDALKEVAGKYPNDPTVLSLYAESIMDLHPWDLWTKEGEAKEWTPEIIQLLEKAKSIDPDHAGAHHLYIHAVEASKTPERGLNSAAVFDNGLVPGAGHLMHMPAHIYIRTGDYHKGSLSNINALRVDSNYVTQCHAQGVYPLAYYPHNYHFLTSTATLEGKSEWAVEAAQEMTDLIDKKVMMDTAWISLQHFYTIPFFVAVKFGKWEEIHDMRLYGSNMSYPNAIQHYAKGMAYLGQKELGKAETELAALEKYAADEGFKDISIWDINTFHDVLQIARLVLKGEIEANKGDFEASIKTLKEAAVLEDALNYNEPSDWFFSVRHHLGAIQLDAGKYEAAATTYLEDLERLPKNGWAYSGLLAAYKKLGQADKAREVGGKLKEAWSHADVELVGSRVQ